MPNPPGRVRPMPGCPRLTPHQAEVFGRLRRQYERTRRPVSASDIGSLGALAHLEEKGFIVVAGAEYGPRGGVTRSYTPVSTTT